MANAEKTRHARQVTLNRVTKAAETQARRVSVAVRRVSEVGKPTEKPVEVTLSAEVQDIPAAPVVNVTSPEPKPVSESTVTATESSPPVQTKEPAPAIPKNSEPCAEEKTKPVEKKEAEKNPEPIKEPEAAKEPDSLTASEQPKESEIVPETISQPAAQPEPPPAEEKSPEPKPVASDTMKTCTSEDTDSPGDVQIAVSKIISRIKKILFAGEKSEKSKWYIPQKWEEISALRKVIMIASAALLLFSCIPLFIGVITPGVLPPACIAIFFFACALYWPLIDGCESLWGNVIIAVAAVLILAGVSYMAFVSGKMISASANTLPENTQEVTVVVLGCKINGDQPSRMLQARLEKAAEFLLEHPQAHCIVTGGQGPDEDYTEALIMKKYLVDKGVSSMRIIMEDRSTSTLENLTFADQLARQYNCHDRFLIVTDRFHQYRAMCTANELGRVSHALNVETVWYLAMQYWFREIAAITRDWVVA